MCVIHPKAVLFAFLALCLQFTGCHGQKSEQSELLKLVAAIPLPKVTGRIDHFAFDSKNKIVFIAALGNNTVEVVDLSQQKVIHTIHDLDEPQGLAFIPKSHSLIIANGGSGQCDIYNSETYQKVTSIDLASDPDNVRYDSIKNIFYVGYGSGGIAMIDAENFKVISSVSFKGHPESFQFNNDQKMYVNIPGKKQIGVVDLAGRTVSATWPIEKAASNFPMCLDEADHRLFIGCRNPAKLLVINSETGKTISTYDIDNDADDIFFDSSAGAIMVSCGEGYVDIIKRINANEYQFSGRVSSRHGARTSFFIPKLHQLIVAAPQNIRESAQLLIYQTNW